MRVNIDRVPVLEPPMASSATHVAILHATRASINQVHAQAPPTVLNATPAQIYSVMEANIAKACVWAERIGTLATKPLFVTRRNTNLQHQL